MGVNLINFSLMTILVMSLVGCGGGSGPSAPVPAPTAPAPIVNNSLEASLDNFLQSNYSDSEPGMAILVVHNDEVVYNKGAGAANLNSGTTIHADTGFRLASVSKPITAFAIMRLVEQQQLTLQDAITDYLPELSSTWDTITIHHLLSHQSGIRDFIDDGWKDGLTNQDVIDYYVSHSALAFIPGEGKEYSNPGYHLLAEIIERASGIRFEDFLQQEIFQPLAMNNTYVADEHSSIRSNDALNFAQFETFFDNYHNYTNGANGVVSSLVDLRLFMQGIVENQIVSEATLSLMLQPHTPELFGVNHYGYGFAVTGSSNEFFHSGRYDGFVTYLYIDPDSDLQIVFLGNGGDSTVNHVNLFELIRSFIPS